MQISVLIVTRIRYIGVINFCVTDPVSVTFKLKLAC